MFRDVFDKAQLKTKKQQKSNNKSEEFWFVWNEREKITTAKAYTRRHEDRRLNCLMRGIRNTIVAAAAAAAHRMLHEIDKTVY